MNAHPVYPRTEPYTIDVTFTVSVSVPADLVPAGADLEAPQFVRDSLVPQLQRALRTVEGDVLDIEFVIDDVRKED